jgi:hypothetical protein
MALLRQAGKILLPGQDLPVRRFDQEIDREAEFELAVAGVFRAVADRLGMRRGPRRA